MTAVSSASGAWDPLLTGHMHTAARDAAALIARAVQRMDARAVAQGSPALGSGLAGVAVFLHYAGRLLPDVRSGERANELLDQAAAALEAVPLAPSLYTGFAGVAWSFAHLCREGFLTSNIDLSDIDVALSDHIRQRARADAYDLILGLVGYGVYFLERLPSPAGRAGLELVVDVLEQTAECALDGVCWRTPQALLPLHRRNVFPDGYYDLGLAHGIPGVMAFLAAVSQAGVAADRCNLLMERSLTWLWQQRLPAGAESAFPCFVAAGRGPTPTSSRAAWCYGDPGVAMAILACARATGDQAVAARASMLLAEAHRRSATESGVVDACLCHGASGLGHLFNRAFQVTRDPSLRRAAVRWFEVALGLRQHDKGVGGFAYGHSDGRGRPIELRAEPGVLVGAAGVGLALLAAITQREPAWDRMLLLGFV